MYAADQVGTELADDYSSIIRELPAELWVSIFEHLDSWADVLDGALANKCLYKTLRANATKLPRPTADLSIISTAEKSLTYLELVPKCGHIRKRKLFEHDLSIFQFFEIDTLILKGPYETKDLLSIIRGLKIGRQRKIRRILMENIHVEDYSVKRFMEHFVEQQRNCERIHLRNCHFPAFPSKMWPEEEHLLQMESLTQFQLENVGQEIDETLALFSVHALAKLGRDLRHRMRRPTTLILLWSAPLPREAEGKVGQCFLEALGQFIENWLHCSDAPAFHIRVLNCDDNFPAKLAEHCRRLDGVSQMFMRFASRAQFSAIKGKYDPDEGVFELRPAPQTLATANRISALSVARFYKLP